MRSTDTGLDELGGSPSVEAAIVAVVIGLVIAFAIAAGRLATAEAAVDHAARSAARAASLERSPAAGRSAAERAAGAGLAERGIRCGETTVTVDTAGLAAPIGTPSVVRATVRCAVSWSDLGLPGGSGSASVESDWTSPVDRWRERP